MAGSGGGTDLSDVDLTLGGFNQDLPEPRTDCLSAVSRIGCVSVRGTYNGEDFEGTCEDDNSLGSGIVIGGYHFVNCQLDLLDGTFALNLLLGQELLDPLPIAYEWQAPDGRKFANYSHDTREFSSHRGEEFQLGDTHAQELAVAGTASLRDGPVSGQTSVWVEGVFAGNLTAKPDCTPDAMGYGCDSIRFRGSYAAFTENDVGP